MDHGQPLFSPSRLAELGQRIATRPGATIVPPGAPPDGVLLLVAGIARVYVTAPDGRRATVRYVRPGELIGAIGDPGPAASMGVESIGACELLRLDAGRVRAEVEGAPGALWRLVGDLESRLDIVQGIAAVNALGSVDERIAVHLLESTTDHAQGHRLVANVTQAELADAVGTAREVVARALGRLRADGVVATRRGQVEILDAVALGRLARSWRPHGGESVERGPTWRPLESKPNDRRADRRERATADARVVSILLIDDDEDVAAVVRALLSGAMPNARVTWASSAAAGRARVDEQTWDVAIVDQRLGDGSGIELLAELQASGIDLPAIMLTGALQRDTDIAAMAAGAVDYLPKAELDAPRLERAVRYALARSGTLARARRETEVAKVEGRTDPLTGLGNRRSFQEAVLAAAGEPSVVVLMADVDGLKRINDRYGHPAGDAALQAIGALLRRALRNADGLARIGGDEFAVVLPNADASALEERVGQSLTARVDGIGTVSATVGIAAGAGSQLAALVAAADASLRSIRAVG